MFGPRQEAVFKARYEGTGNDRDNVNSPLKFAPLTELMQVAELHKIEQLWVGKPIDLFWQLARLLWFSRGGRTQYNPERKVQLGREEEYKFRGVDVFSFEEWNKLVSVSARLEGIEHLVSSLRQNIAPDQIRHMQTDIPVFVECDAASLEPEEVLPTSILRVKARLDVGMPTSFTGWWLYNGHDNKFRLASGNGHVRIAAGRLTVCHSKFNDEQAVDIIRKQSGQEQPANHCAEAADNDPRQPDAAQIEAMNEHEFRLFCSIMQGMAARGAFSETMRFDITSKLQDAEQSAKLGVKYWDERARKAE